MSPAERIFFARARRRLRDLEPEMLSAMLRAFAIIRDTLPAAELERIIASGNIDLLFARVLTEEVLDRAMLPVRDRIRRTTEKAFKFATADLPKGGKVDGVLAVAFDHLSPHVVTAIRQLESAAINTLKGDVKEVTRAFIENGLRDGRAPSAVARELRSVIGMAPNQAAYVRNLRLELETERFADAEARVLLDKRFNLAKLATLSDAERAKRIDTIVSAYGRSMVAMNANVNAKTHTFDAYKQGQRLAWQDAQDKGVVPDGYVTMRQWVHYDAQPHPREEHIAMGKLPPVPADQPYQNGDNYAGESDPFGCKCLDRFFIARAA